MNILLTGSEGFIGRHVKIALYKHHVEYWDIKNGKNAKNISKRDLENTDVVVHLAALISVPASWEEPKLYFKRNAMLTLRLVDRAAQAGVKKFIFASSSSVYARDLSPYGASKLSAEHILDCYKNRLKIHRLRFFNVYGPNQNTNFPGVITKIIHAIKNDEEFLVNGSGDNSRDYTYVEDVAKVIAALAEKDINIKDPTDIATGKTKTVNELIAKLEKISGKKLKVKNGPTLPEIEHSTGEITPTQLIETMTDIDKGLKETYDKIN